ACRYRCLGQAVYSAVHAGADLWDRCLGDALPGAVHAGAGAWYRLYTVQCMQVQ
ncbi:hypothetical protein NDU88_011729, partial [Pleurodeles waltl]